jgi:hypothetical protein
MLNETVKTPTSAPESETPPRISRIILWCSISSGVIIIMTRALLWIIIHFVTPFYILPLVAAELLIFLTCFVYSSGYLIRKRKTMRLKAGVPFLIQVFALMVTFFLPLDSWITDLDFRLNLTKREEVVRMVGTGELKPNISYNDELIYLPAGYRYLSRGGGEIMVEQQKGGYRIFFFTYRGILDNFSGFMYRPDDSPPQNDDFTSDWIQIVKLRDHWYFVASN